MKVMADIQIQFPLPLTNLCKNTRKVALRRLMKDDCHNLSQEADLRRYSNCIPVYCTTLDRFGLAYLLGSSTISWILNYAGPMKFFIYCPLMRVSDGSNGMAANLSSESPVREHKSWSG